MSWIRSFGGQARGVQPQLGIRLRLLSRSTGKWADSGGEDAKFGLNTAQLMAALERLRAEAGGFLASAAFPHRVAGTGYSQCGAAVQEAARFYAKVRKEGFPVEYLDAVAVWR